MYTRMCCQRFLMQQQNRCVCRPNFAFTIMYQSLQSVLSAMLLIPFKINATKLNVLFCATSINKLPAFLRCSFFQDENDKKEPKQTTIIKCTHLSQISWQNYFSACIAPNDIVVEKERRIEYGIFFFQPEPSYQVT